MRFQQEKQARLADLRFKMEQELQEQLKKPA